MKVFIIFFGILLINVSFLSYQGDLNRYLQYQEYLKATAEECAAGAALYYDEEAYAGGHFKFNYSEGTEYLEYILNKTKQQGPSLSKSTEIAYEVEFQDDEKGYKGEENIPSVTVGLTATTEDIFHLPFLQVTKVKREAKYELPQ